MLWDPGSPDQPRGAVLATPGLEEAELFPAPLQLSSLHGRPLRGWGPHRHQCPLGGSASYSGHQEWAQCCSGLGSLSPHPDPSVSISPTAFLAPDFDSGLLHQNLPVLCPFSSVFLLSLSSSESPLPSVTSNFSTTASGDRILLLGF